MKDTLRQNEFEKIQFNSKDGLLMTADYYPIANPKALILLCHRSHCNRGEYRETAPKLNALGFSALAIDQRSGMKVFGVINETSALAKDQGLPTGYLDARQDIEAAVDYAFELNGHSPIIILGSSYSASLALLIATTSDKIRAVMAFSPGEYLKNVIVADEIKTLAVPVFATGAMKEMEDVNSVMRHIDPAYVTLFTPQVNGFHGSKTLWNSVEGYETYWKALEQFITSI